MKWLTLAILVGTVALSQPAGAIQLLVRVEAPVGWEEIQFDEQDEGDSSLDDFDGDGVQDLILKGSSNGSEDDLLEVRDMQNNTLWAYQLRLYDLCPGCPPDPDYIYLYFWGFADLDPSPGKEAVVGWETGGPLWHRNAAIVSTDDGHIIATLLGADPEFADLNGDGKLEMIFSPFEEDAVEVWGYGSGTASVPSSSPTIGTMGNAFPNPTPGQVRMTFSLGSSSHATLDVFDARGRLVRTVVDSDFPGGDYGFDWDAMDNAGRRVAAGTYFYRLSVDGRAQASKKAVIVR